MLDSLLINRSPIFPKVIKVLHTHKYYTSISNVARLLIVNACGGIYTDVDYLYPNFAITFPKEISELLSVFK